MDDKEEPHWLNRTVAGVSITSALGDFAYETTNVLLPGFLAALGIPAAALGAIEGTADAVSSFTKLGSGYLSDRLSRRKPLVVFGYFLTAAAQTLFAIANGWGLILLGRVLAWLGRGIRGPLRDALLAEAVTPKTRGRAFGFHRMADTIGAVVGPLLGVALLTWARGPADEDPSKPFRFVFWLTLVPGLLSVLSFAIIVPEGRRVVGSSARTLFGSLRSLPGPFRRYLGAVGVFGLGDFAPSLLVLAATEVLTPTQGVVRAAQLAGLLYVGRNLVQTLASYPVGHLADRFGHRGTLVVGYVLGVLTAAGCALVFAFELREVSVLAGVFFVAGLQIAVREAIESTVTAEYLPSENRGIGYGALGTVNGIGDLVSSASLGLIWTAVSPAAGFGIAAALMGCGAVVLATIAPPRSSAPS